MEPIQKKAQKTNELTKDQMLSALHLLDHKLCQKIKLIIGGGGAMALAHDFPLSTTDVDAIPTGIELSELDEQVKKVAKELHIPSDWLNPYYSTFTYTLPSDYSDRLIPVFQGKNIRALALGKSDLLILKCYAHRPKDVAHAKALIKKNADVDFVENHIQSLLEKTIPQSQEALDFLYDLLDQMDQG